MRLAQPRGIQIHSPVLVSVISLNAIGAAGGEDGARVERTRRIDGGTDIHAPDAS